MYEKTTTDLPNENTSLPFDNVALCISGGGFRASGYGLGVISYLRQVPYSEDKTLLEKVSYLSTTSGGSLLAALYMKSLLNNETFEDFYKQAINFMDGEKLLSKALKKLSTKSEWTHTTKNRNLINSFAKVYDDDLKGQLFADYFDRNNEIHIKENCYNATEFNTGITFRFKTQPTIGNKYIGIEKEAAKNLKVADIIAASSCFPAGFEPLIFPNDFSTTQQEVTFFEKYTQVTDPYGQNLTTPFALMDGGITDNQGIESMMIANRKAKFSLVIVADVSNKFMSPWKPPLQSNQSDNTSVNTYAKALTYMPWILAVSILLLCFNLTEKLGLVLLLPSLLGTALYFRWKSIVKSIKKIFDTDNNINWDTIMSRYLQFFSSLPLNTLSYLLKVRLTSVSMLAYDIFLKQVRRMRYDELYEDNNWKHKRISTLIYELVKPNIPNLEAELKKKVANALKEKLNDDAEVKSLLSNEYEKIWQILKPTEQLMSIAQTASSMGTTLWFDRNDVNTERLNKIIATGQFTTCFNLLEYLLIAELRNPTNFVYAEIKSKLLNDWSNFKTNPFWLVEQNN